LAPELSRGGNGLALERRGLSTTVELLKPRGVKAEIEARLRRETRVREAPGESDRQKVRHTHLPHSPPLF
jgi:hypothetical protein